MTQSPVDGAALIGTPNGQTLGLFAIVAYVALMPKELTHLVCVFVGALGYLLYLLLQPQPGPRSPIFVPASQSQEEPGAQVQAGKSGKGLELPASVPLHGPASATATKKPIEACDAANVKAPVGGARRADAVASPPGKPGPAISDVDTTDDEATGASSDEGSEAAGGERPGDVRRVCCPRFARLKAAPRAGPQPGAARGLPQEPEEGRPKNAGQQAGRKVPDERSGTRIVALRRLLKDEERPRAAARAAAAGGPNGKALSADAEPFLLRPRLSAQAAPFVCGPCGPQEAAEVCWQWQSRGACPRGSSCKWGHPPRVEQRPRGGAAVEAARPCLFAEEVPPWGPHDFAFVQMPPADCMPSPFFW